MASLTSIPESLNGSYCLGEVVLTCNGTALPTLTWYYENGSEIAKFIPTEDVTSPEILNSKLPEVEISIVSAIQVAPRSENFNIISEFRGNTSSIGSTFNGMTISCGTLQTRNSTAVSVDIVEIGG